MEYIYVHGYKNLNDIEIYFEPQSSVNSFIGNNGSGKSNILEVIAIIFSSVLDDVNPDGFEFCLKYTIDDYIIEIRNTEKLLEILKNGEKVSKKDVNQIFPKAIFLYYAGETKRLKQLSDEIIDKRFEKTLKKDEEIAFKFLTYLSVDDFGPSLLSNHIFRNDTYYNICKLVDIKDICPPITINLKKPSWSKNGKADNFWNAVGAVAKELNTFAQKGTYSIIDNNRSKIVIEDIEKLKDDSIGALGLFTIFKMLAQADVLDGLEFEVVKGNDKFSYTGLSEGEKQLSQLLSILEITKEYKALFLLDEFDSYLHPNWQRKFVDIVNEINIRGQILFTTHSPLTLGKMRKDNIILLKDGVAYNPSSETFNRDITEVLEELMDVKKRPPEIEKMIFDFRESAMQKNKEMAHNLYAQLKEVLSEDDPFFINAKISLARLER
ncbi:ATP-binding protein [Alkaliphilus metalliredigens]|nr:ATP-binding protein [Alkaliphilus metalliredigens]